LSTLYITHPIFAEHLVPPGHPERPDRMRALAAALDGEAFRDLVREQAPRGSLDTVRLVHPAEFVDEIEKTSPESGLAMLDGDTYMSPKSFEAEMHAVGAVTHAIDAVMAGSAQNAFLGLRPPGHHVEPVRAMGFGIFNQVAAGARYAQRKHGLGRVAVVDFDVHHGNGTQAIFYRDPTVLYASTHQMPLYPGTGARGETGVGNIFNAPLSPGWGGKEFRQAVETVWLPALESFGPEMILISAGFDAHQRDPLGGLNLTAQDFAWVTKKIMEVADRHAGGRVVSALEGGYDLQGLADSAAAHVDALMRG
jgi:acetoin utilization deacetylase AcuC-like enzyme